MYVRTVGLFIYSVVSSHYKSILLCTSYPHFLHLTIPTLLTQHVLRSLPHYPPRNPSRLCTKGNLPSPRWPQHLYSPLPPFHPHVLTNRTRHNWPPRRQHRHSRYLRHLRPLLTNNPRCRYPLNPTKCTCPNPRFFPRRRRET